MALLPWFCHRCLSRDWWCANAWLHLQNIQAIRCLISIERNMKQMLHTSFVTGFWLSQCLSCRRWPMEISPIDPGLYTVQLVICLLNEYIKVFLCQGAFCHCAAFWISDVKAATRLNGITGGYLVTEGIFTHRSLCNGQNTVVLLYFHLLPEAGCVWTV